jgi:hypothetical protein
MVGDTVIIFHFRVIKGVRVVPALIVVNANNCFSTRLQAPQAIKKDSGVATILRS